MTWKRRLNTSRRGEQSLAIILNLKATLAWKTGGSIVHNNFEARILAVRLQTHDNRGIFLISAYAPIGVADDTVWDNFLHKLVRCICKKMPNDILVIGIDSNSSSGINQSNEKTLVMKSVGKFGLPHVNNSGIRFSSYLETNFSLLWPPITKRKVTSLGHILDQNYPTRSTIWLPRSPVYAISLTQVPLPR